MTSKCDVTKHLYTQSDDFDMITAMSPPELTVSEELEDSSDELQQPTPQRPNQKFNLDDAFSIHEDEDSASLDFNPNSILRDLQSADSMGGGKHDWEDNWENTNNEAAVVQIELDASISTLDTDTVEPHHSPVTPPQASSSYQSMESEDPPATPPDDPSAAPDSHFTTMTLSPPSHSSPHPYVHEFDHAYPNVIIDASKPHVADVRTQGVSPSASQQTTDSSSVISQTPADVISSSSTSNNSDSHRTNQSVSLTSTGSSHPTTVYRPPPSASHGKPRSSGPSAFQKVVSKTRPPYLPPKQKDEDEKHRKEWEEMMERSRLAGK